MQSARTERSSNQNGGSSETGNSLLAGNYDEAEAAADFQRALAEWRGQKAAAANGAANGDSAATANSVKSQPPPKQKPVQAFKPQVKFAPQRPAGSGKFSLYYFYIRLWLYVCW